MSAGVGASQEWGSMAGQAERQPEQKQESREELTKQVVGGQGLPSEWGTLRPPQLAFFPVERWVQPILYS